MQNSGSLNLEMFANVTKTKQNKNHNLLWLEVFRAQWNILDSEAC